MIKQYFFSHNFYKKLFTISEIEVCDKAFSLCMDICERWLNVEKGKLQVISNSLQTCTVVPPAVGVEILREIIKIVKVVNEYKRVWSQYIIERNSYT